MKFDSIDATSPFDSTITFLFFFFILLSLLYNFLFLIYHYISLIHVTKKLNELNLTKLLENKKSIDEIKNSKRKLFKDLYSRIIELIGSNFVSNEPNEKNLNFKLKKVNNMITIQCYKRNRLFFLSIIAFVLFVIELFLRLTKLNLFLLKSTSFPNFFILFNAIGPAIFLFSLCIVNLGLSIWISISTRISFKKIEIRIAELVYNYSKTKKNIGNNKILKDL